MVNKTRVVVVDETKSVGSGPVVYWMQRDHRVDDNWALLYAQEQAATRGVPLQVIFTSVPTCGPRATRRRYDFMRRGLMAVEERLRSLGIPFYVLSGNPNKTVPAFVTQHFVGEVVTDQNPLRRPRRWREEVAAALSVRFVVVDAHNIVPVWVASTKVEFSAYTLRPKLTARLPDYLTGFPDVARQVAIPLPPPVDWEQAFAVATFDEQVPPVAWLESGEEAARQALGHFCTSTLAGYAARRNDPTRDGQSNLSPYLHFGHIAAQRVALSVTAAEAPAVDKAAFLEELIVRRELADNFCFYSTERYDSLAAAHPWAQVTLREHAADKREAMYSLEEFTLGRTHDRLWNAMQQQLVTTGKLHGWCRMYWAKKILEWTPDVQTAIDTALLLNDRYSLDGNDPSGVAGVMWSIAGVHDRAWGERPVFGKIRYMNFAGAKRKFAVDAYVANWSPRLL